MVNLVGHLDGASHVGLVLRGRGSDDGDGADGQAVVRDAKFVTIAKINVEAKTQIYKVNRYTEGIVLSSQKKLCCHKDL